MMRALFVILCLVAAPLNARAQLTQGVVNNLITSNLPSCGDMCINAAALRQTLDVMNQATFQFTQFPNTFTAAQTITTTGLTTIHGPGSPLFIWANPGASIPAGYNLLRVWMGDNPTATPANPGTVAATIAGINGNGRTNVWAMNLISGQSSAVIGAAQGALTGLEIDTFSDIAYTQATTPFGANPVTNLQLYNSPAISKV